MVAEEDDSKGPQPDRIAQQAAVVPDANVWLSASAGSGKTQVLSARVIRLLLAGAKPEEILCLTFTKAAAAEMAERINRKLASWVQMKDGLLGAELRAIGADYARDKLSSGPQIFRRNPRRAWRRVADHDDPRLLPVIIGQLSRRGRDHARL
jgi:ATP-dependent helicase/nuclease subunit A